MLSGIDGALIEKERYVTNHIDILISYWDRDLVCRFANQSFADTFGKQPDELIDKMKEPDITGAQFQQTLPHIQGVFEGKIQVFEREFKTPEGLTQHKIATYIPDFKNGNVIGFFAYAIDAAKINNGNYPYKLEFNNNGGIRSSEKILEDVTVTLRLSLLKEFPGISKLARRHFISEAKLKRDFKLKYNTTLFGYYRKEQMKLAEAYLKEKGMNKKQVAALFNFSNPSNFVNCFAKYIKQKGELEVPNKSQEIIDHEYKTFISQTPFAIAMVDKNLNYVAYSNKWMADYNMDQHSYINKKCHSIFPNSPEKSEKLYLLTLNGLLSNTGEDQITKPDGSRQWIKWDVRPWFRYDNAIGGLLISTEDITMLKLKEKENQVLNKCAEITHVGIWSMNLKENTLFWSSIMKGIFEAPADFEPQLATVFGYLKKGESGTLFTKSFNKKIKKNMPIDMEADIITEKGNLKRVRIIGYPEFSNGVCEKVSGICLELDAIPVTRGAKLAANVSNS